MTERKRVRCLGCNRVNKYWLCNACHRHTTPGDRLTLLEHQELLKNPRSWWGPEDGYKAFRAFIQWSWAQTEITVAHGAFQAREQAEIDQIWGKPLLGANH